MAKIDKDFIFVWIPRVGGTSISQILAKYDVPIIYKDWQFKFIKNKGGLVLSHIDLAELLKRNIIKRRYFEKAFKFAFIRNPWDRLLSLYMYHQKMGYFTDITFEKFCIKLLLKFKIRHCPLIRHKGLPPVGLYNVLGLSQANPQVEWLADENNKIFVDFIGRYENLEKDMKKIFKILSINEDMRKLNSTQHKHYRDYYSTRTKKIVSMLCRKDIEIFNYTF